MSILQVSCPHLFRKNNGTLFKEIYEDSTGCIKIKKEDSEQVSTPIEKVEISAENSSQAIESVVERKPKVKGSTAEAIRSVIDQINNTEEPLSIPKPVNTIVQETAPVTNTSRTTTPVEQVPIKNNKIAELEKVLTEYGVKFTKPVRTEYNLLEVCLVNNDNSRTKITVDYELLYREEFKFFNGAGLEAGDEYLYPVYKLTKDSIMALVNGQPLTYGHQIEYKAFRVNQLVDLMTYTGKPELLDKIIDRIYNAIILDEKYLEELYNAVNKEPIHFAFNRADSADNFSLVSSNKNFDSRLSGDKLPTSKTLYVNFKPDKNSGKVEVTYNVKK